MKYVPRRQKSEWLDKVLKVTEGADLSDRFGLYIELKEWERLAELVRKAKSAALEEVRSRGSTAADRGAARLALGGSAV